MDRELFQLLLVVVQVYGLHGMLHVGLITELILIVPEMIYLLEHLYAIKQRVAVIDMDLLMR
jgi:hypothetical protein